jgi:DNA-damage-inducible protein J
VNDNIKQDVEALFNGLGMNISTAVNVFFVQCLRERAIPFQIRSADANMSLKDALREAQEQAKVNGTSEMTLDEINEIIAEVRREMRAEKAAQ